METLYGNMSKEQTAAFLNKAANALQKQIDAKLNPATASQRPTARRLRIVNAMREDGLKLEFAQRVLFALAQAHEKGSIVRFPFLEELRHRSEIELIHSYEKLNTYNRDLNWHLNHEQKTFDRLSIYSLEDWRKANAQLKDFLVEFSPEKDQDHKKRYREIRDLEMEVITRKIQGFFPTPPKLVRTMLEWAEIKNGHSVLDPSAGKGDLLDGVREEFGDKVDCFAIELNSSLRKILELKEYTILGSDFFDFTGQKFDRILMNPPFENGQDIDHVRHAFGLLKPNGRLIAIMGEGVFFRKQKKEKAFLQFLHENNARVSQTMKDMFKDGFVSTGVAVRIVQLDKQETTNHNQELNQALERIQKRIQYLKETHGLHGTKKKVIHEHYQEFIPELEIKFNPQNKVFVPTKVIRKSSDAYEILMQLMNMEVLSAREEFVVLFLSQSNQVKGYSIMFKGGIQNVVADVRLIAASVYKALAVNVVVAHNHPSGNKQPSEADKRLTRDLKHALSTFNINLLDHLIVTPNSFYSFADEVEL